MTPTDETIRHDVLTRLKWEPALEQTDIGVQVSNGIVTLSGQVDTCPKKCAATLAAKNTTGVRAVQNNIQSYDIY